MIPDLIRHASATGQHLLITQLRDLLGALSTLGRHNAVAILDGATNLLSIRPKLVATASARAREALGDDHYAELTERGKGFSLADLQEYLLELADTLE